MHQGEYGPGVQKSMDLLIKYGDAFGAEKMARAISTHIFALPETLVTDMTQGAKTRIPATTHARSGDPRPFMKYGILENEEGQRLAGDIW